MGLSQLLFGHDVTTSDLMHLSFRKQFSDYLPWLAYDPETKVYLNADDTIGFLWECGPLSFANEKVTTTLEGLFRVNHPEGTIIQFILYADNYLKPYINAYKSCKQRDDQVTLEQANVYARFMEDGVKGMENIAGIPLRDFRLFVSLKMPLNSPETKALNIEDLFNTVMEILKGAGLHPSVFEPPELLDWSRRMFNTHASANNSHYDEEVPLAKQVIFAETLVKNHYDHMEIGNRFWRCTTPKKFPKEVDFFQTNQLFGGIWGLQNDTDQYRTPFLFTLNIVFQNMGPELHMKCNLLLQQQAVGSLAPSLMRKKEENLWAVDEIEKGTKFIKIIPVLWLFGNDKKTVSESIVRARRVWEAQGYIMQEDKGILPILFLSSLPFGLINKGRNVDNIDRHQIAPSNSVASILPVQSDFSGGGKPVLVFVGRKGQLCGLDIFDKHVNNSNVFVAASSGSGKSFLVNYLSYNYYAAGALCRIIDIGGSYKKMTKLCNARFLDFGGADNLCMNPFSSIIDEKYDLPIVSSIMAQMVYSSAENQKPSETEMTLLKDAVSWAYGKYGTDAGVDAVHQYLSTYPDKAINSTLATSKSAAEITGIAHTMAFNLREFTSDGHYGQYFNGRSNFNIKDDEFVVLELEHLKPQKELFKVITLQVINAVTQDLYLSDRSRPRLIIFDEAWQFIKSGQILQEVIEEGYRRARKYGGSFVVITQSLLDLKQFGSVGDVIKSNSAFKFYLEADDFEKAKAENLIDYDEFTMKWLKSTKSNRPKYSEIFMDTPFGLGIARLTVDRFSYWVYTSDAGEIAKIDALVDQGHSYLDAINHLAGRRSTDAA